MDVEQVWAPLLGVVVGGGLSYVAQVTTGRLTARAEDRRQALQLAEARRAERLALLREFIALTQEGIRLAERRLDHAPAPDPDWRGAARDLIDRLWIAERMVQVLFPPGFYTCARAYATAVDEALWNHPGPPETLWDHLREPQRRFLAEAGRTVA
ncbi:hypothetical protein ACIPSE_37365 [Streptomyces sp. NPDC090106]|uniref:hypothetical protein n=1 Tax=Streptomyces sp. NPDC090106 TaxID=3365946 RepID=UPI0038024C35